MISLSSPLVRPAHFLGLELVFAAAVAITLAHAIGRARAGERHALFPWLVAFFYGVWMELIAFNFLDNYQHATFTLQLYHGKLPFYVVCLYPVFHYAGLKLIERWRLGFAAEALLAGFAICLIDIPFDVAGVRAGWWRWSDADPTLAVRWLGVPVTSYYWYCIFGAVYAALCRALRGFVSRRALWVQFALAPLIAAGVIVGGTLAFLPFHGLRALHVPEGLVVAAHLAACAVLAAYVLVRAARVGGRANGSAIDTAAASGTARALAAIPLALAAYQLSVLIALAARGPLDRAPAALATAAAAALALALLTWPVLRRQRAAVPSA
jgi:hypothetical protein